MKKTSLKKKLKELFQTEAQVLVAYLFGSIARESTSPMSDIDIAILLKRGAQNITLAKRLLF